MKFATILFALLMLISLHDASSKHHTTLTSSGGSGAKIALSELCVDFGKVSRKGTPPSHTIYVRNDGDQPLIITHTATMCKCIKSKFSRRPIAPHDSIPFKISYQPLRGEKGHFHKILRIYSTSQQSPCMMVTVQGESI